MVEVVATLRVAPAQLLEQRGGIVRFRHAQHQHDFVQAIEALLAQHREAGRARRCQAGRGRRPGQDFTAYHRLAARIGFQHGAVLAQQAAHLVQSQLAHVGQLADAAKARGYIAQQFATEQIATAQRQCRCLQGYIEAGQAQLGLCSSRACDDSKC
jgi:hypothetical protein